MGAGGQASPQGAGGSRVALRGLARWGAEQARRGAAGCSPTCAVSSCASCSGLRRIWTFSCRWRKHPRSLGRETRHSLRTGSGTRLSQLRRGPQRWRPLPGPGRRLPARRGVPGAGTALALHLPGVSLYFSLVQRGFRCDPAAAAPGPAGLGRALLEPLSRGAAGEVSGLCPLLLRGAGSLRACAPIAPSFVGF